MEDNILLRDIHVTMLLPGIIGILGTTRRVVGYIARTKEDTETINYVATVTNPERQCAVVSLRLR